MIGPQNDDHIILFMADLFESVGADLTGEDVTRVGNDDGDRLFQLCRKGIL